MTKQIEWLDWMLFSKVRAKIIATTETGRAYEYGNYLPAKQLSDVWKNVTKKRLTVGDSRVRPSHAANENEWRIPLDKVFWGTGSDLPPAWVNCRCTTLYDVN
jgi:uncharacterized protein with gpF-like domain